MATLSERNARVAATPAVRAAANRANVELASIRGTGAGGRITTADVVAAGGWRETVKWAESTGRIAASRVADYSAMAERDPVAAVELLKSLLPPPPPPPPMSSSPTGGAWDRNPLVNAARRANPAKVAAASVKAPAPTLFSNGDLPPFTASGIDPSTLLQVPWQARHTIAQEPDQARAYQMLQDYSGPDGELSAAMDCAGSPENRSYEVRADEWVADGLSDDQLAQMFGL